MKEENELKEFRLGHVFRVRLTAQPTFLVSSALLWALLGGFGTIVCKFGFAESILGGFVAMLLHWMTELCHHLGHALAARRTGYPMMGVRLGFLIGQSLYPASEPELPARIHIRRALGGPIASLAVAAPTAIGLAILPSGTLLWWLAFFLFVDNALNVSQIFLPLGFNDGSTVFHWWGKR